MAATVKTRQPRLRASCDGCFLAKVKCSKARPLCARCLSCGIMCNYSPSSRCGKPKPDNNHTPQSNPPHNPHMRALLDNNKPMAPYVPITHDSNLYPLQTSWPTPPASGVGDSMSRNPSFSSGFSLPGTNTNRMNEQDQLSAHSNLYSGITWDPSVAIPGTTFSGIALPTTRLQEPHVRSHSFDASMPISMSMDVPMEMPMEWSYTPQEMLSCSQVPTPNSIASNYFPSPTAVQSTLYQQNQYEQQDQQNEQNGSQCTCFIDCLQSAMDLHNISANPQINFEIALQYNQKAIQGCFNMLECRTCLSKPHMDTNIMLLAATIGKVASTYKTITSLYSEPGIIPGLEAPPSDGIGKISLGTYQFDGKGTWTKMDSWAHEKNLQALLDIFRDVCREVFLNDPDMLKAVIHHTGQKITSMMVLDHRTMDGSLPA
ncbi:hypothetical protein F5Y03DRAFT_217172 [Xylaria venustula]|nr:hypothetical protein F5Y03DRAFT_217172 [Xylaria venustula]